MNLTPQIEAETNKRTKYIVANQNKGYEEIINKITNALNQEPDLHKARKEPK